MTGTSGFLVVGNRNAGSSDQASIERAAGRLASHDTTDLAWTGDPDELDEVIGGLDGRRLVIAGGDGSIHAAVNSIDRLGLLDDVTVGIVPFGTGNDLAGGMGLSDPDQALDACLGDATRELDLLRTEDRVAVNAIHLGIGARVASSASAWKARLGPVAYPVAAIATGVRYGGFDATVRVTDPDGEEFSVDGRFTMIAVANGWRIGGGFPLAPAASPADGRLELVLVDALSLAGRARFAWHGRRGAHHELDDVDRRPARRVVVETDGVGVNLDGEVVDASAVDVRVDPGRLRILVPG